MSGIGGTGSPTGSPRRGARRAGSATGTTRPALAAIQHRPPTPRVCAVDAVVLLLAGLLALLPLADAYAGPRWWVAGLGGLLLGIGCTALARHLSWGPLITVLLGAGGYLLLGAAFAVPDQAVAGVLPGPDALRALLVGPVEVWRTVLTLQVPLGVEHGTLVLPFLVAEIGALLATTFLWRTRWPALSAAVVVAMFVVAACFGTQDAQWPVLRGAVLTVALVLWMRLRALRHLRSSWTRRLVLTTGLIGFAAVTAGGLVSAVPTPTDRQVLREYVEPPLNELDFKSPLAAYRSYYKDHKGDVLFRFDGLPAGDPCVRLATMDSYDGIVWNVSTTDRSTGTSAFRPAPAATSGSAITVTVGSGYRGPWLPTVGTATGLSREHDAAPDVSRDLLINTVSGASADYGDARDGDVYRVDWSPGARCDNDARATVADRSVPLVPMDFTIETLDEVTAQWLGRSGAGTDFERVTALEQAFRKNGFFNDGQDPREFGYSAPGHGAKRLADLARDPHRIVGNDEQYAAAMAYAVQRLGIPARVVLGFEGVRSDGSVTGDDIAAWVEVPFEGFGWMRFDPTPPEDQVPPPLNESPDPVPQPYVVQPPVLPKEPADVQGVAPEGASRDSGAEVWDLLWQILGYVWIVLQVLVLTSPLWFVLLVKWLRRRRRRRAADPLHRVSGGWREVVDRARDLGVRMPAGSTRNESGTLLAERFEGAGTVALAGVADQHVFGVDSPSDADVAAYWADVRTAMKRMRSAAPWWRRLWCGLSPASVAWRAGLARIGRRTGRLLGTVTGVRFLARRWRRRPRPLRRRRRSLP